MKLEQYEQRRLQIIARSVVGKSILDIGHAQLPNQFLSNFNCIGYDRNKPKKMREIYKHLLQVSLRVNDSANIILDIIVKTT